MKLPRQPAPIIPKRGEIWRVDFEPTVGSEISSDKGGRGDTRPALVMSLPKIGERTVKLCVPITDYSPQRDEGRWWRVAIGDSDESGLTKLSCADVSQTRALDTSRFERKIGKAHSTEVQATADQLAASVGSYMEIDGEAE